MAGFDLGCIFGGVIFLWHEYRQIFDSVLDPEAAKLEMLWLLIVSIISGLVFGTFTVYFTKLAIVFAPSAIGAALLMVGYLILCPLFGLSNEPSSLQVVAWVALTVLA